jgi:5-methylcytosine-specific restriction endonuclease McrA
MKTLQLNASYETIGFIPFKKLMKLLVKNKVEVVAEWNDEYITWTSGRMPYPATVRMKYYVRSVHRKIRFNKKAVIKRDCYMCQYCGKALEGKDATVDHIVPQSKGGATSWSNCVCSCFPCNARKANKTPEEAGLVLINKPHIPNRSMIHSEFINLPHKHESWYDYFS